MNRFPLEPLGFLKWIVLSLVVVLTLQTFNIQVLIFKITVVINFHNITKHHHFRCSDCWANHTHLNIIMR